MNRYLLFFLLVFSGIFQSLAQNWNINLNTDSISILGPYSDTRNIIFNSFKYPQYDPRYLKYGLHFKNNLVNQMSNSIRIAQLQGSPTLGAWGAGTEIVYGGQFQADGGQSVPHLVVQNGGKIRFAASAVVDLVLSGSFFTKQFWCMGDGTGIIELDPGFIADRSRGGLADSGFGSIRLNNVIFITHETQGLPLGYRPNPSLINSHFVFERNPGSVWQVKTNDQEFKGGLWVKTSMTIDALKNVNVSGVKSIWSDYVNFGGVFLEDTAVVLTKKGAGTFTLSGEHGYAPDTKFKVEDGAVEFKTDPFNELDSAFYKARGRLHGQNLAVQLEGVSKIISRANSVRLRALKCISPNSETQIWYGSTLYAKSAEISGQFSFKFPNGILVSAGDSFQVMKFNSRTGNFAYLDLPTFNGAISWDTNGFYSRGVLKIATGSVVTSGKSAEMETDKTKIFPNPFQQTIQIAGSDIQEFTLLDMHGKVVFSKHDFSDKTIRLAHILSGIYVYKIKKENGKMASGKLVKE